MTADAFITQLKTIFNTTIADAKVEDLFDAVADELTLNGAAITNMTGATAGSKVAPTMTQSQKAAIRRIFRVLYASWHKNADNTATASVGNLSISVSDLMANPVVLQYIEHTAELLKRQSLDPPIYAANDPLPDQSY